MDIINPYIHGGESVPFDGFGNGSRSFNGVDDYIDWGDSDDFSFGDSSNDSPFSISIWCKPNDLYKFRMLNKYIDPTNKEWLFNFNTTDQLTFFIYDERSFARRGGATPALSSLQGTWIHCVATYDGRGGTNAHEGIKIYVNGVSQTITINNAGSYTAMHNTNCAMTTHADTNKYTDGKLADIRLYSSELTSTDIAGLYTGKDITTNLVGHWIKDTPSLLDHAGNNDATNYGSKFSYDNPSPAVEFGSMSRSFDGENDHVDLGNSTDFSFSDGLQDEPFSLCAWIKCDDNARFRVLSKDNGAGSGYEWLLATDAGGNLNVYLIDGGTFRGREYTTPLPENEWIHVASTYDGSGGTNFRLGLKLYVNGVQVDNADYGFGGYVAMDASTNNKVFIGRYGTSYSDGKIADARIYDAELSSSDISDLYNGTNVTTNLIGHWLTNNDDVKDYAGTNDGTNNGGAIYSYDNPNALVEYGGASRDFSGISQHIETSDIVSIGTGSMSWSCWLNADSIANTRTIVRMGRTSSSGNARYDGLQILLVNSKISGYLIDYTNSGNVFSVLSTNNAIIGDWYHVALTLDVNAQTLELFINGVSEGSTSVSSIYPWDITAISPLSIGSREISDSNFTANEFNGKIADVRLYDSALTSTEAYELYKGVDHRTNLIGQWLTNSDDVEDKAGTNDGTNNGSTYSTDSPL